MQPLFTATARFDSNDGESWSEYFEWAKIPALKEVVSLDIILCERLIKELDPEDRKHVAAADGRADFFEDLNYLRRRVADAGRRNILGVYRHPPREIIEGPGGGFVFVGYDL